MLERLMLWLFPRLLLEGTPFFEGWYERERTQDVRFWRILFPTLAAVCLVKAHFLQPSVPLPDTWTADHYWLAAVCLAAGAVYFVPGVLRSRGYRIPAAAGLLAMCYLLADTLEPYGKDQYLTIFIVIIVAAWCLRTSMFLSSCFVALAIYLQWDIAESAGVTEAVAVSFSVGVLVFVAIARSDYAGRIRYHLAHQRMLASQEQAIQMSIEFSDRIRAFLPREISSRVTTAITKNQLTVQQAVDLVLHPEERAISCLFTDIRGFTRGTKENESFVSDGVIPNVVRCTRIVERHFGIPRKVGDLLFAYFDDASAEANILCCLSAASEIVEANARFNQTNELRLQIRRYLLISTGIAVVGNLGGLDSSIDISAKGKPVDLLSQMDQLTKASKFREQVNETDVVLCAQSAELLRRIRSDWDLRQIDLTQLRAGSDLVNIGSLWAFPTNRHNRDALAETLERFGRAADTGEPENREIDSPELRRSAL